jgi:PAS domain S-box-containing protein
MLETITHHADLPVWIRDGEGKFYYVNNQFKKIFKLENVEIIGKKNHEILDKRTAKQFDENDKKVKEQNKPIIVEEKVVTKDGIKYYQSNLFPLTNIPGLDFAIGGLAADITPQKEAELELKLALKEKDILLESIGEAFFSVDKDWTIIYWNKNAEELMEVSRNEVIGKNLWDLFPVAKDLIFYEKYSEVFKTQEPVYFEGYYPPDNLWLDVSAYPSENSISERAVTRRGRSC